MGLWSTPPKQNTSPHTHVPLNVVHSCLQVLDVIGGNKLRVAAGEEDPARHAPQHVLQEGPHHVDGDLACREVHPLPWEGEEEEEGGRGRMGWREREREEEERRKGGMEETAVRHRTTCAQLTHTSPVLHVHVHVLGHYR